MKKPSSTFDIMESDLYDSVRSILAKARAKIYTTANSAMVDAYWNIGRVIVEKQGGSDRSVYGNKLVKMISEKLTNEFGSGFSVVNLTLMRRFYLAFPIVYTLSKQLSWSHYRALIAVDNDKARQYYLEESIKSKWSVRVLQRQISTMYYERLLANQVDPETVKALVKKDSLPVKDILRSPAILEFTGITKADYVEDDLQRALILHLGRFLMELGRGFCLVGEQRPIPVGKKVFHCDLVFYNYLARCFFLIDLKVGEVTPEDIGQMQLYKHYYEREMMNPGDNPPIGIVLGSQADSTVVNYTLNENERNLFAVKYHLSLPTAEELQLEINRERRAIEEAIALRQPQLASTSMGK